MLLINNFFPLCFPLVPFNPAVITHNISSFILFKSKDLDFNLFFSHGIFRASFNAHTYVNVLLIFDKYGIEDPKLTSI